MTSTIQKHSQKIFKGQSEPRQWLAGCNFWLRKAEVLQVALTSSWHAYWGRYLIYMVVRVLAGLDWSKKFSFCQTVTCPRLSKTDPYCEPYQNFCVPHYYAYLCLTKTSIYPITTPIYLLYNLLLGTFSHRF